MGEYKKAELDHKFISLQVDKNMATRGERAKVPKLQSITTADILQKLTAEWW